MMGRDVSRSSAAALVAGSWFWSVSVAKETSPLVSAMMGFSVVFSIEVVVKTGREISRAFSADSGQTKQRVAGTFLARRGSTLQSGADQLLDDFLFCLVLALCPQFDIPRL